MNLHFHQLFGQFIRYTIRLTINSVHLAQPSDQEGNWIVRSNFASFCNLSSHATKCDIESLSKDCNWGFIRGRQAVYDEISQSVYNV